MYYLLNTFIQWNYVNTHLASCVCSVAPSNIVEQVLNLIQKLQFYGFQIIGCKYCLLEQPDSLTRNLRKLFHKYHFSFRTNVSSISATRNKMRTLSFNCYTISNTKRGKRQPATYILPLPITVVESKVASLFGIVLSSTIVYSSDLPCFWEKNKKKEHIIFF